MAASKLQALWNHPAGPKTSVISSRQTRHELSYQQRQSLSHTYGTLVHFWAPTFKWGINIANIADFALPPEKLSYPQQGAVACSGLIWCRYGTVITPKNWNVSAVNLTMSVIGFYQLSRKIRHDYFQEEKKPVPAEEQ